MRVSRDVYAKGTDLMAKGPHKIEYEVLEGWEKLPEGWSFVEVAGVGVDSQDRVYVFNRGHRPGERRACQTAATVRPDRP